LCGTYTKRAEKARKIFRNTDEIIQLHTTILFQLNATMGRANLIDRDRSNFDGDRLPMATRNAQDHSIAIGTVFEDNIPRLRAVHGEYLGGSGEACRKLMELQQEPRGRAWLDECRGAMKRLTNAFDLDSLLIKPLQRITKYPLLVSALLQHTPADHPDRPLLLKAKEALESTLADHPPGQSRA
jgi:dynamin-binding protein